MRSTSTEKRCSASSDVPPSTASSALMSSGAPRWLTRSRKGPGKVFSRPTSSPMNFLSAICPCPSRDPSGEIAPHHVLPVRPIVRPSRPDIEPHLHTALGEKPSELDRVVDVGVLLSRGDHFRLLRPQGPEVGLVGETGQKRHQVGEVRVVVVVSVQPPVGVVSAAEGDEAADPVRMP